MLLHTLICWPFPRIWIIGREGTAVIDGGLEKVICMTIINWVYNIGTGPIKQTILLKSYSNSPIYHGLFIWTHLMVFCSDIRNDMAQALKFEMIEIEN